MQQLGRCGELYASRPSEPKTKPMQANSIARGLIKSVYPRKTSQFSGSQFCLSLSSFKSEREQLAVTISTQRCRRAVGDPLATRRNTRAAVSQEEAAQRQRRRARRRPPAVRPTDRPSVGPLRGCSAAAAAAAAARRRLAHRVL
jgi:hypothetical protein